MTPKAANSEDDPPRSAVKGRERVSDGIEPTTLAGLLRRSRFRFMPADCESRAGTQGRIGREFGLATISPDRNALQFTNCGVAEFLPRSIQITVQPSPNNRADGPLWLAPVRRT